MVAGAVWICQHHHHTIAEGYECPWCVMEERDLAEGIVRAARKSLESVKDRMDEHAYAELANALNP